MVEVVVCWLFGNQMKSGRVAFLGGVSGLVFFVGFVESVVCWPVVVMSEQKRRVHDTNMQ